jgi:hypothetical protein
LAIVVMLFSLLVSGPVSMLSFLLGLVALSGVVVLVVFGYWTYGFYTLYYTLDRDALRIRWAGFETVVPIVDIQNATQAEPDGRRTALPFLRWPGYCIGKGYIEGLGQAVYYAVNMQDNLVFVSTDTVTYVISPDDPEGFCQALALRQNLGPVHDLEMQITASGLLGLPFWADHFAHRLWGLALVLNLGLFAYLCAVYPNLAPVLPFHFDALGQVDRLAPTIAVFFIPFIGVLSLFLNGLMGLLVHSRHRLATLLLWCGTSLVQAYLWVAVLGITFHATGV